VPASCSWRSYQRWIREAAPYCTPSKFNLRNAVRIDWIA